MATWERRDVWGVSTAICVIFSKTEGCCGKLLFGCELHCLHIACDRNVRFLSSLPRISIRRNLSGIEPI